LLPQRTSCLRRTCCLDDRVIGMALGLGIGQEQFERLWGFGHSQFTSDFPRITSMPTQVRSAVSSSASLSQKFSFSQSFYPEVSGRPRGHLNWWVISAALH
jgi:hypothetical protein